MPFRNPHVSNVSISVEINADGSTDVLVIETDLYLNKRHPGYNATAVRDLVQAAREYLTLNSDPVTHIRLVSNRSGQL
jgi:hypothetical protein